VRVKLCECGCGQPTAIAKRTDSRKGWVKGQPVKFAYGHNGRTRPQEECECGCGLLARRGRRFVHGHSSNARRSVYTHQRRFIDNEGYVRVYVGPEHPMAFSTGYVFEHRLVMANALGRKLEPSEVVHHRNETRDDNRLANLELYASGGEHSAQHNRRRSVATP
jgi:hypothetical protein